VALFLSGGVNLKLLYGTANLAKIQHMRDMLRGLDIEIIGLNDIELETQPIDESGNNPLENAKIKANAYYKAYKMPVFSCDSGLYIEKIEDLENQKQPGVHVRRVSGKELNDEEMIEYYTSVASKLGGSARAKYKNAICLILNEECIFEYEGDDIGSETFMISSKSHEKRDTGFPLDSISVDIKSGKHYMDLKDCIDEDNDDCPGRGFRKFFSEVLNCELKL
jgi:XTP/dITP diphosphohydrolase